MQGSKVANNLPTIWAHVAHHDLALPVSVHKSVVHYSASRVPFRSYSDTFPGCKGQALGRKHPNQTIDACCGSEAKHGKHPASCRRGSRAKPREHAAIDQPHTVAFRPVKPRNMWEPCFGASLPCSARVSKETLWRATSLSSESSWGFSSQGQGVAADLLGKRLRAWPWISTGTLTHAARI